VHCAVAHSRAGEAYDAALQLIAPSSSNHCIASAPHMRSAVVKCTSVDESCTERAKHKVCVVQDGLHVDVDKASVKV
jgi:hypothetical protein